MKPLKAAITITMAITMLLGTCSALPIDPEQRLSAVEQTPIAVFNLSEASGDVLLNAQADISEIRNHVDSSYPEALQSNDITVTDYGTVSVGDYEVSTTLYTFQPTNGDTQASGTTVHTYTQSGYTRFKLYFYLEFSCNGNEVIPQPSTGDYWSSTPSASVTVTDTDYGWDNYDNCIYHWVYTAQYGTSQVTGRYAYLKCSPTGTITTMNQSYVLPA